MEMVLRFIGTARESTIDSPASTMSAFNPKRPYTVKDSKGMSVFAPKN